MSCNKEIEVLVYLAISSSVAFAAPEQTNISFTAVIFSEGFFEELVKRFLDELRLSLHDVLVCECILPFQV